VKHNILEACVFLPFVNMCVQNGNTLSVFYILKSDFKEKKRRVSSLGKHVFHKCCKYL